MFVTVLCAHVRVVDLFVAYYSEKNTALRKLNLRELLPTDFELNV